MIVAQLMLTTLLALVLLYAAVEYRRVPGVALLTILAALSGLYFVWFPDNAMWLAEIAGVGRGVDLILYNWVVINLIILLNLHLKLRAQMELITKLAREVAIMNASRGG
jgi:hypothetical protein